MEIFNVLVNGVPLIFVVMGLVAWIKKLGLEGVAVQIASMLIGLLFGIGYMVSANGVPEADLFAAWFGYAVYGIGLGLAASGIYDTGVEILEKGIAILLNR